MFQPFTPYYCEENYTNVILPEEEIRSDDSGKWLIIGWPGVDGIDFRIQVDNADSGIFAYYPIDGCTVKIAESDVDLIEKWKSGLIIL